MINKIHITLGAVALILVTAFVYTLACFHRVDKHEFGFAYNRFTGEISPVKRQGWFLMAWPKYDIHAIDTRPYQIQITANTNVGNRVLNAKLVRFNPEGINTFIQWHGRDAGDTLGTLQEIFKCYAFAPDGGESCPFIEVLNGTSALAQTPEK